MAPVDWQAGVVYTAAFFGLLLYLWDGWGWVPKFSDVTGQLRSCSHTQSYQTLQSYQLITHYICCWVSKALCGFCWIGKQGRECPDTKVWAATRKPGRICFTMSSCERAPTPNSSRLSAVLNGPWEFLTTIWLAPLQRTLWPAWKHSPIHIRTSTQRTPLAFITMMYERETRNDKLSQVHWFWAICMIWFGAVDIETLLNCFSLPCLYKKFSKILTVLGCGLLLCATEIKIFFTLCQL